MRTRSRPSRSSARPTHRVSPARGFTLTELLVAVAVLVVVIIATARIFGTVTKVTGAGEANADLLQSAQTIERQIREDIARISREGFVLIESVSVPNDINGAGTPLLNSALPATARVRSDRLVFFVEGQFSSTQYVGSDDKLVSGGETYWPNKEATAARVYYGHGVQIPNADPLTDAFPLLANGEPLLPWTFDSPSNGPDLSLRNWSSGAYVRDVIATQPSAREWILARQSMLLADDGVNGFLRYNHRMVDAKNSTNSIWVIPASPAQTAGANFDPGVMSSRVDIAGSTLDKVRQAITGFGASLNNAVQQRDQIYRSLNDFSGSQPATNLRYPRAEKVAPGPDRADQMLTNPTLAANCSSFIVEWTWADRTGRVIDNTTGVSVDPTPASASSGDEWVGLILTEDAQQPWFGFPDGARGVQPLWNSFAYAGSGLCNGPWGCLGFPIFPESIEGALASGGPPDVNGQPIGISPGQPGLRIYRAAFGLNQSRPFDLDPTTGAMAIGAGLNYTPWPTALRITMTLHDPEQRFAEGRTFQFVVELPQR